MLFRTSSQLLTSGRSKRHHKAAAVIFDTLCVNRQAARRIELSTNINIMPAKYRVWRVVPFSVLKQANGKLDYNSSCNELKQRAVIYNRAGLQTAPRDRQLEQEWRQRIDPRPEQQLQLVVLQSLHQPKEASQTRSSLALIATHKSDEYIYILVECPL